VTSTRRSASLPSKSVPRKSIRSPASLSVTGPSVISSPAFMYHIEKVFAPAFQKKLPSYVFRTPLSLTKCVVKRTKLSLSDSGSGSRCAASRRRTRMRRRPRRRRQASRAVRRVRNVERPAARLSERGGRGPEHKRNGDERGFHGSSSVRERCVILRGPRRAGRFPGAWPRAHDAAAGSANRNSGGAGEPTRSNGRCAGAHATA